MLIYNHNFEFIGIDKKDLQKLGFKTFSELINTCNDFADLFVKKPGYIHNFKNLKWILYILNSDAHEAKAIIEINGTEFATNLTVETLYMKESQDKESYIITLSNLHQTNATSEPLVQIDQKIVHSDTEIQKQPLIEPETRPEMPYDDETQTAIKTEIKQQQQTKESPMLGDYLIKAQPTADKQIDGYLYDPKVVADELGLPIDLIEEFIGDFIQQAYSFKDDLYTALNNGDYDKLKNLSHKLKGVAANLRIEDAFEAIRIVNASSDMAEIKQNLDIFYSIVYKLDKKEQPLQAAQDTAMSQEIPTQEDFESAVDDDVYANLLQDEDLKSVHEDTATKKIEDVAQTVQKAPTHENISPAPQADIIVHYDKQKAINELGLDEDIIKKLLKNYKTQLIASIKDIEDALDSSNLTKVHQLALNIKGTSDNLRLLQISTLLEQLIFTDNSQEINDTVTTLKQCLAQI